MAIHRLKNKPRRAARDPLCRAERGTSGKEGSAGSVLLKPDALPIVRSEGIRRSRTQILDTSRLSLLTFFGEAKKVSAARHERDSGEKARSTS